jgi:hypothetical protein
MIVSRFIEAISKHGLSWPAITLGFLHMVAFLGILFSRPPLPPPGTEPCPPEGACFDLWNFRVGVYVAGRYFHHGLMFKGLTLADLPALLLLGVPISYVLSLIWEPSRVTETYVSAAIWLFVGTLQWWIIGMLLYARRTKRQQRILKDQAQI